MMIYDLVLGNSASIKVMKNDENITHRQVIFIIRQEDHYEENNQLTIGSIYDDKNNTPFIYHCLLTEEQGMVEYILLNWSLDEFDFDHELIQYIGLENELADHQLTLNELKESKTFKYKKFFDEGTYENNISMDGNNNMK